MSADIGLVAFQGSPRSQQIIFIVAKTERREKVASTL